MIGRGEQFAEQFWLGDVERLIGPEGLQPVVFELRVFGIKLADPGCQRRQDVGWPAGFEFELGMGAREFFGGSEHVEQLADGRADDLRFVDQRAALEGHAPDATVGVIAAVVAEIDFAVLNDRVVPVGDVERAVGSDLGVDRAEGGVGRLDDLGLFFRRVT